MKAERMFISISMALAVAGVARKASAYTEHSFPGGGCALSLAAQDSDGEADGRVFITGCTFAGTLGEGENIFDANPGGGWSIFSSQQGIEVAADSDGDLGLVDAKGNPYVYTGSSWNNLGGCATSIAMAGSFYGPIVTGCTTESSGGYGIFYYDHGWVELGGQATQVAADSAGHLWIVNAHGNIYYRTSTTLGEGSWQQVSGCATSIAVDPQDNVWVVGCTSTGPNGNGLFHGGAGGFTQVPGAQAWKVSVDSSEEPWTLDTSGNIDYWTNP